MKNQHGLSREIPSEVKRAVRQQSGFGCVKCGSAIYQYEHVDPTFTEATAHDPTAMTLLCGGCHDLVTRGFLSKATLRQHMENPRCLEAGFSFGPFDIGSAWPTITIGPVTLREVEVVVRMAGTDTLSILPPEEEGGPFRISALFTDSGGTEVLRIVENEWQSSTGNWDVEVVGPRITVRRAQGEIALAIRAEAPHALVVERLNMHFQGVDIEAAATRLVVRVAGHRTFTARAAEFHGNAVGIDVGADGSARLGSGGGSLYIGHMIT